MISKTGSKVRRVKFLNVFNWLVVNDIGNIRLVKVQSRNKPSVTNTMKHQLTGDDQIKLTKNVWVNS